MSVIFSFSRILYKKHLTQSIFASEIIEKGEGPRIYGWPLNLQSPEQGQVKQGWL